MVWHLCVGSNCGILRSVKSGAGWGAGESIVDTPFNEENPDTDGVSVVYDADRGTGPDIYFQPLSGGTETQLQLAGQQVTRASRAASSPSRVGRPMETPQTSTSM